MMVKVPRIKVKGTTTPRVTLARRFALTGQNPELFFESTATCKVIQLN
jgi:hypothetical protein